jgi:hypothetical protein
VIYFYPKDDTPGCTIEAIDFTARRAEFSAAGTIVVGISKDPVKSHDKVIRKHALDLILASDEAGTVCETKSSSEGTPMARSIASMSSRPDPRCRGSKVSRGARGSAAGVVSACIRSTLEAGFVATAEDEAGWLMAVSGRPGGGSYRATRVRVKSGLAGVAGPGRKW